MPKNNTQWSFNSAAGANSRVFDSGSTVYDSASLTFDGIVTDQSFITTHIATTWANASKTNTQWATNPSATSAPYDAANGYDALTDNYDAVINGQSTVTTHVPTVWSAA